MVFLVTGGTGLVGNNLVRLLVSRGETVRVLVRSTGIPRALEGLAVEIAHGDIRDTAALQTACAGAHVVFHAAGHIHMGWGEKKLADEINVQGTKNVATACRLAGARLVQVSTVNALGVGRREKPATEESYDPRVVPCPYILSKQSADRVVQAAMDQGLDAVFVYPSLLFGPWDWKPSSGRMILEVGSAFTPLAPWGGISACDARDVAAAMLNAALQAPRGRHYVLAGKNLPYIDLWRLIAHTTGVRPPLMRAGPIVRYIGAIWGDLQRVVTGHEPVLNTAGVRITDQYHYFDSSRAVSELGYRIRPLEETIADAWNWLRQQKIGH